MFRSRSEGGSTYVCIPKSDMDSWGDNWFERLKTRWDLSERLEIEKYRKKYGGSPHPCFREIEGYDFSSLKSIGFETGSESASQFYSDTENADQEKIPTRATESSIINSPSSNSELLMVSSSEPSYEGLPQLPSGESWIILKIGASSELIRNWLVNNQKKFFQKAIEERTVFSPPDPIEQPRCRCMIC